MQGHEASGAIAPTDIRQADKRETLFPEHCIPPRSARGRAVTHEDLVTVASGAGVALVGRTLGRAIYLGTQVLLARLLGPASFGLYAIGWTVFRLVGRAAPVGLDNGVIRFGGPAWHENTDLVGSVIRDALRLASLFAVLAGAAVFVAAPWFAESVFKDARLTPVLQLFAPAVAVMVIVQVAAAATRISQRMAASVLAEDLLPPVITLVTLGVLAIRTPITLGMAIAVSTLALVAAALILIRPLGQLVPSGGRALFGGMHSAGNLLRFSAPTAIAGVFVLYVMWVDRLLVGYYLPTRDVGVYHAASQVPLLFALVLSGFSSAIQPMAASLHSLGEQARLGTLFKVSTRWALYLTVPPLLVILFEPGLVMEVIFGKGYEGGEATLVVLSLGQAVNAATGAVGVMLVMTGQQRRWLYTSATMFAANLAISCILLPRIGVVGAALGTTLSISGMFIIGLIHLRRHLGLWPYDRSLYKGAVALVATIGSLALMRLVSVPQATLDLLLTAVCAGAAFFAVLVAQGIGAEERSVLLALKRRLGRGSDRVRY